MGIQWSWVDRRSYDLRCLLQCFISKFKASKLIAPLGLSLLLSSCKCQTVSAVYLSMIIMYSIYYVLTHIKCCKMFKHSRPISDVSAYTHKHDVTKNSSLAVSRNRATKRSCVLSLTKVMYNQDQGTMIENMANHHS